jgi:hypothetical protein
VTGANQQTSALTFNIIIQSSQQQLAPFYVKNGSLANWFLLDPRVRASAKSPFDILLLNQGYNRLLFACYFLSETCPLIVSPAGFL